MWSTGINRNIVECKVSRSGSPQADSAVLIETLWNVKMNPPSRSPWMTFVLIETLWNVKYLRRQVNKHDQGINRNIVECKAR